jgi:hypothetical protein
MALFATTKKEGAEQGVLAPEPKLNTAMPHKEGKFSAFLKGGEKDYKVKDEWKNYTKYPVKSFVDKEEYSKLAFDPNIRHRIPTMPNSLVYRAIAEVPWEP